MTFMGTQFSRLNAKIPAGTQPLSDEQLYSAAPSIFATTAHESRSERFSVIPTFGIVQAMRAEGFAPFLAKQGRSRIEGKENFTKHLIRFRRPDTAPALNETFSEVILVNANDGTSAYKLYSGLFRLVCLNGMVTSVGEGSSVRVGHSGDVRNRVIEGSYEVLKGSERSADAAREWQGVQLPHHAQLALAEASLAVRFGEPDGTIRTAVRPEQLLQARRQQDLDNDLWTTFNRIQENAMQGGLQTVTRDPVTQQQRRSTTRPVANVSGDVKLNRALWTLGQRMAEMMGRAA